MQLSKLAQYLGGILKGPDKEILGASTLEDSGETDITFLSNPKYKDKVATSSAGAIIVSEELSTPMSQVIADNPYLCFAHALALLYPEKPHQKGISSQAFVDKDAYIDDSAHIYPHAYIGAGAYVSKGCIIYPGCYIGDNVTIGDETRLYPNVVIYDGCKIGKHCIIHAGTVIGSDGFGFVWDGNAHAKIPQIGIVIMGDYVEIGSNCTIDRAALTSTKIGSDIKTDNLVHIGHNVTIGDHTLIVAQTGISGSAHIGKSVVLAGQCGVTGHITIGDGCVAAARAGITSDLPPGKVVSGYPAMDHKQWLRSQQIYKDLPKVLKRIRELERRLDKLDKG